MLKRIICSLLSKRRQFSSTNILTDKQLSEESNYYDRFKNYIDNEDTSEVVKYIDDDANESSPVNLEKTLNTKWPIYSNKNHYPLFDTYINDISTNRYKKEFVTKVNIDSLYILVYKLGKGSFAIVWFAIEFKNFLRDINEKKLNI